MGVRAAGDLASKIFRLLILTINKRTINNGQEDYLKDQVECIGVAEHDLFPERLYPRTVPGSSISSPHGKGYWGAGTSPIRGALFVFFPRQGVFPPFHFYATPLARHAMDAFPMSVEPKGVGREEDHSAVIEQK